MTTTETDPRGMTPRQIDETLAALNEQGAHAERRIDAAIDNLRRYLGDRPRRHGRGVVTYKFTVAEVLEQVRAKVAEPGYTDAPWSTFAKDLGRYDTAVAELEQVVAGEQRYAVEYQRRPWPRFFPVPGGHIHSSTSCRTCHRMGKRTDVRWMPDLSGHTVAEAVAALGPTLCTVCYPDAPVEYTEGVKRNHCTGQTPVPGTSNTVGMRTWADCPDCRERPLVTAGGVLRRHAPKA